MLSSQHFTGPQVHSKLTSGTVLGRELHCLLCGLYEQHENRLAWKGEHQQAKELYSEAPAS